jgi:hypothetical protein
MQKQRCKNCRDSECRLRDDGFCSVNCNIEFGEKLKTLQIRCQEAYAKDVSHIQNMSRN